MVGIRIRIATEDDAALIYDLGRRAFLEAFGAENSPENMEAYLKKSFSLEKQRREILAPGSEFVILYNADSPAGYARLLAGSGPPCITGTNPIELCRLYLLSQFKGQGLGSALMQHCLTFAAVKGHDVVWLGVWEHNQRAIAFYQKWGFSTVGVQTFHLGNDPQQDLVMQRMLR